MQSNFFSFNSPSTEFRLWRTETVLVSVEPDESQLFDTPSGLDSLLDELDWDDTDELD
jgi:hypothetical protein